MDILFVTRRNNLNQLVLDKFNGNKSALARAAGVHHNHINLLLSNNEKHKRNLGEELARRIEENLGLPTYWLDKDHSEENTSTVVVSAMPIDAALNRVLKTAHIASVTLSAAWVRAAMPEVSGPDSLYLAAIATTEVQPDLSPGDVVLVDAGVKAYTVDGVYLLTTGDGAVFLRRIRKQLSGVFIVSAGSDTESMDALSGLTVLGRVAQKLQIGRV